MPTLKDTEASLSYVQCFLYLVSSSLNVSIFHLTWLDTFCTELVLVRLKVIVAASSEFEQVLIWVSVLMKSEKTGICAACCHLPNP